VAEEKKKITPEELKEIKAIDTMSRPFYVSRKHLRAMFEGFEFGTMALSTFGGVLKRIDKNFDLDAAWAEEVEKGSSEKVADAGTKAMSAMGPKASVKEAVAEMDEIGVEYMFIDQMIEWSHRYNKFVGGWATIEEIDGWCKESNGRIKGGVNYNPFDIEGSLKDVERAVKELGFPYVWIHPGSFGGPEDRRFYPLYAKCVELGVPVCMQTGQSAEPLSSEDMHPMLADRVALDFPGLTLVLTHTGFPWFREWISMVWKHPNVYGNIGAYMPLSLDPAIVNFMNGPGRSKVFWATNGLGLTRSKTEFLQLPIKDAAKKAILRDNALKIFKLG
jgi:hypothetical protein